ncbi:hypothetical protein ACFSZS_09720 [Seohaeicola zhoushanensis]
MAEGVGLTIAKFTPATQELVGKYLPGTSGANPIDIGAVVSREERKSEEALRAAIDDDNVNVLALLQDCQDSLNPATLDNYMLHIPGYAAVGASVTKPVVVISPTSGEIAPRIRAEFDRAGIPIVRGCAQVWPRCGASRTRSKARPVDGPGRVAITLPARLNSPPSGKRSQATAARCLPNWPSGC